MPLEQLIYTSDAAHRMTGRDIDQILLASRRNNSAVDVTGVLLFAGLIGAAMDPPEQTGGGVFLQVLEGSSAALDDLYQRISADARHHQVRTIWRGEVRQRDFGEWSMGFGPLTYDQMRTYTGDTTHAASGNLMAKRILHAFAEGHWGQGAA